MFNNLKSSFLSGIVLIIPLGVTLFVFQIMLTKVGQPASDQFFFFLDKELKQDTWISLGLSSLAILIVAVVITLIGWFSKHFFGRLAIRIFEKFVSNVPIVRTVYNTVKEIVDTFSQQQKAVFQKAVLFEYPRKGIWAIGFLTSDGKGEVPRKTNQELSNLFVPTTPNPTSGFLLMIPTEDLIDLDMTVTEAMKVIISGGAVVPPDRTVQNTEEPDLSLSV